MQESIIVDTFLNGRYSSAEVDAANWYHSFIAAGRDPLYMNPARSTVAAWNMAANRMERRKGLVLLRFMLIILFI